MFGVGQRWLGKPEAKRSQKLTKRNKLLPNYGIEGKPKTNSVITVRKYL